ncbi:putative iron-regulated membrane protein [Gibbsiella quercinecans]|uniref:PepSY domain-containing protein n=1 Tax=Gibbsiella quercinecans TaxID=929813 RepID=A0A250AX62_9GAMM|nr:PepSY domain-containing protein [Gibbsiella quercinecans]ATA18558.1 hypothetical protein AWC35_03920 [Gibbsiella quercinecans]RLM04322.1 hypothetical protein BIY30_20410 [Gibbsiella quercinecans]TCT82384.1 putative iron-regulated membrane protein [Gibbsiella quercinecans]
MPESQGSALADAAQFHAAPRGVSQSGFISLLMRLHFYIGLFTGPFLLIAALSGIFYALTPQLESRIYAAQLYHHSQGEELPLAQQIAAAQAVAPAGALLSAVRPAPAAGENTRVLFHLAGLGEFERLAVFIDPITAQPHGQLAAYGTSGILPLRTWLDRLHRSLQLGEPGRIYSELAASWLWLLALGGLVQWCAGKKHARKKTGLRRWHARAGGLLLIGLLFFSATGLTWSKWAGGNIGTWRHQFGWATPALSTALGEQTAPPADEHALHHGHDMQTMAAVEGDRDAALYDRILRSARQAGIDAGKIEIKQPVKAGLAWTVSEIDHRWPVQVDAVAVDPRSLAIIDRVSFAQYPMAAKLTRWGIDLHMGVLFGLANTLALVVFATGLAAMVIMGYVMWWRRWPTRRLAQPLGSPLLFLRQTPKGLLLVIVALAVLFGFCLPVMGASLLAFLLCDVLRWQWLRQRAFSPEESK